MIHFLFIVVIFLTTVIKAGVNYVRDTCRSYNRDYSHVFYLFCGRDRGVMRSVIVIIVFVVLVIIVTLCVSAILTVILADTLIAVICNDMYVFFFFLVCFSGCSLSVNNSIGLIDVAYSDPLYCLWTIANFDITNAMAVFVIQRIILNSCRYLELTKLFFLGFSFLNYEREQA